LSEYEEGQGSQPAIAFRQLNMWHNCNTVFLRWRYEMEPETLTAITILETAPAEAGSIFPWVITKAYDEFNSGAWLVNLGVFIPSKCSGEVGSDTYGVIMRV
jgi:hypothetical protein